MLEIFLMHIDKLIIVKYNFEFMTNNNGLLCNVECQLKPWIQTFVTYRLLMIFVPGQKKCASWHMIQLVTSFLQKFARFEIILMHTHSKEKIASWIIQTR